MSHLESEPTGRLPAHLAHISSRDETAGTSDRHGAPPVGLPADARYEPGREMYDGVPYAPPHSRWIESSRGKIVDGRAVAVHPGMSESIYVDVVEAPFDEAMSETSRRSPEVAAPTSAREENEQPVVPTTAKRGLFHGHARKAAALAVAIGLCGAAGSFARMGQAETPNPAAVAAAEKARAAEASEAQAKRQIAQMALEMRLMSAKVETLRAEIERGRFADDSRGLKRSVDALRSGLETSKSETATTLGQMAQKLDRLQRGSSNGERLAQIAERLDRIERRGFVSNEVTSSIGRSTATPASAPLPVPKPAAISHAGSHQGEGTATTTRVAATSLPGPKSISPDKESDGRPDSKPQPKVIPGLVLRDIQGNVAIVEGRGGIFGISRGDFIPGVGRVENIERHGRDSVVVTSRGVITTHFQR